VPSTLDHASVGADAVGASEAAEDVGNVSSKVRERWIMGAFGR